MGSHAYCETDRGVTASVERAGRPNTTFDLRKNHRLTKQRRTAKSPRGPVQLADTAYSWIFKHPSSTDAKSSGSHCASSHSSGTSSRTDSSIRRGNGASSVSFCICAAAINSTAFAETRAGCYLVVQRFCSTAADTDTGYNCTHGSGFSLSTVVTVCINLDTRPSTDAAKSLGGPLQTEATSLPFAPDPILQLHV